ncbi:MAG: hypothetical protein CYPHOPRED_003609 [Cyphobasidiales sp. Tagirdzhanova-0007]|nr:MAG: hypothetical protein CYPHOPRED_003609 [Cyphobasidiales sp. Tagirdzhanova-0007]
MGFAGPISCLFSVVQLCVEPEYVGIISGLMVSVRAIGGSLGPAISYSVGNSKIKQLVPQYISQAAIAAGLADSSVSLLVESLLAANQTMVAGVPGITTYIIAAASEASLRAYAKAYSYVWIILAPFVFVALLGCLLVKGVQPLMTAAVDRPVLAQQINGT